MPGYTRAVITPVPFLWLCGPTGVGKSTVGWEIFRQLADAGSATSYVDADQLGLCYPADGDDPCNDRIKARNLGAVWTAFRAAGAETLILSGGIEFAHLIRDYADQVPGTALTLCRLRADHDTLTERFMGRGWMPDLVNEALIEADELDRLAFGDVCVDTDGLTVAEVAQLVRRSADGWPAPSASQAAAAPRDVPAGRRPTDDPVPVLLLCGPTAVGKSTVGYEVFTRVRTRVKAAYVDLAQIGFCHPAPVDDPGNHRLRAANLAAMWPAFRDAGARCLIVTGRVNEAATIRAYTDALPAATFTVCRLLASRETLADRILRRGHGDGPAIPGDELKGQPPVHLQQVAEQAVRDADRLRHAQIGDLCVETDGRSVEDVAQLIVDAAVGWTPTSGGSTQSEFHQVI